MGKILCISVKEGKTGAVGQEYKNRISLEDPTLLIIFFEDMESFFNAPIEKACRMYLEKKSHRGKAFPF
jgi:hypothetical protein